MKRPEIPNAPTPARRTGADGVPAESASQSVRAAPPERTPAAARPPRAAPPKRPVAARATPKPKATERSVKLAKLAKPAKPAKQDDPAKAARREIRAARKRRKAQLRAERRRFTAARRRRRWVLTIAGGAVLALLVGVFGVAYSPLMAVRTVTVEGTTTLDPAQVEAALAGQLGTPLPLVSVEQIATELAAFPAVQSFVAESHPPSTLVVRITERTPIGSIHRVGRYDVVDSAGVVLSSSAERAGGVPLLDIDTTDSAAFRTLGSMLLALPAELRAQLSAAGATSAVDAWFQIAGGPKVVWGDVNNQPLKLKVLQSLLASTGGAVSEIDVSAPNSPFVR